MPSCSCYRRVDLRQFPALCCLCLARSRPARPALPSRREAARSASAATVGRQRACGRKAGDCARNGPHEELPAQGIARARVVLSGRLARCQREAARAFYGAACPRSGTGNLLKDQERLLLAARVDVADGGAMTQLARPDPARNRSGRGHVRSGPASASTEPLPADRPRLLRAGRPVPGWAVGAALLAPVVLVGGWLVAGALRRPLIARCGRR